MESPPPFLQFNLGKAKHDSWKHFLTSPSGMSNWAREWNGILSDYQKEFPDSDAIFRKARQVDSKITFGVRYIPLPHCLFRL